jgi:AcrR family transcriptional regulator
MRAPPPGRYLAMVSIVRTFVDEARRAQLIQCTIDVINELGYQRASLAEIAKRAGITKAAIFYHFANRDELIREVLTTVTTKGAEFMLPRVFATTSPAGQFTAYIEAFVEAIALNTAEIRALLEIGKNFADLRDQDESLRQSSIAPLEDILRRGQEAGEFRQFDTRSMALALTAALEAILPQKGWYPDLDLSAHSAELVTLFTLATRAG